MDFWLAYLSEVQAYREGTPGAIGVPDSDKDGLEEVSK